MMKKFILFGFAILSALGIQAAESYPSNITYNNVNYALTHDDTRNDVIMGYSIKITSATVDASNATNNGSISMTTTANGTRTNTYYFNAVALNVDGGTSVVYNLELNDFVAQEILPTSSDISGGTFVLGDAGYPSTMSLAADNNNNIFDFNSINNVNKYFYPDSVWNDDKEIYEIKFISTQDTLTLKSAIPNYRQAYYYLNVTQSGNRNFYLINKVTVSEVINHTTTNQYNCQVTEIHPNFRVTSTITNVTLGSRIWRIPDSSIFSEATNLALITVSGTGSDFQFKKGILYKMEASMEKVIVTATTTLTDQTLPESIDSIYTNAFKNAPEGVVLTSMNYTLGLHLNGNNEFKVVFLIPDEQATISEAANGGYLVEGKLTQFHIDNLKLKGTYMNFRKAQLLTDIHFDNQDNTTNTLLYFDANPGKEVTGYKNVIIGDRCEKCIITDNGSESFYCPIAFTAKYLDYTRQFDCKWKTVALPFSMNDYTISNFLIAGKLTGFDESTNTFTFLYSNSISANIPYIVKTKGDDQTAEYHNLKDVVVEKTNPRITEVGEASFVPVFERDSLWSSLNEYENFYGIQNIYDEETRSWKNYMQIFDGVRINPFRAYLTAPKITSEVARYRLVDAMDQLIEEGEFPITTSGIEDVKEFGTSEAIYNLNGQRVNKVRRGLNIIDGKIVINK